MQSSSPKPSEAFVSQIADAYEHLYDLVYLRRHPTLDQLAPETGLSAKDRAWRAHHRLLDAIEALNPGPHAPVHAREVRRYHLMVLRYLEGLEVQTVADELGISRRHYFREHNAAIAAIADALAQSASLREPQGSASAAEEDVAPITRLELLRLETARLAHSQDQETVREVALGAVQIAQEMARRSGLTLEADLAGDLGLATEHSMLRQLLLGILSHLLERLADGTVRVSAMLKDGRAAFRLLATGTLRDTGPDEEEAEVGLSVVRELAVAQGAELQIDCGEDAAAGFALVLPAALPRSILVVDDNEDALRLVHQFLSHHGYRVVTAQSGEEAIERARTLQPYAITLDLMMPEHDGWDVLQTLSNQPATQDIPVIVCTVLAAKEMALSLGAAAFLAKPLTEQALLATLAALE